MDPATTIVFALFGTLVFASAAAWSWAVPRLIARRPLLEYEPRRPVPWGFLDLVIVGLLCLGLPGLVVQGVRTMYEVPAGTLFEGIPRDALAAMLLAGAASTAAAAAIGVLIVALRTGAAGRDFGVGLRGIGRDVATGVVAFVMLAAPVLAIQLVLTQWFPTKHPLIEIVRQSGSEQFLWLTALSAVVVAPIVEELLFRAILQGWLERAAVGCNDATQLLFGGPSTESPAFSQARGTPVAVIATDVTASVDGHNPYRPPAAVMDLNPVLEPWLAGPTRPWPFIVSAAIFAAMHLGNGPDPVPLFVLALGLGYVYQRTHRWLPCVVVHFLLNSWTMVTLLVLLRSGKL